MPTSIYILQFAIYRIFIFNNFMVFFLLLSYLSISELTEGLNPLNFSHMLQIDLKFLN